MKRREFFKQAGISSAALVSLPAVAALEPGPSGGNDSGQSEHEHGHAGDDNDLKGPLASATISFGQWNADPPLDRFPNNSPQSGEPPPADPG